MTPSSLAKVSGFHEVYNAQSLHLDNYMQSSQGRLARVRRSSMLNAESAKLIDGSRCSLVHCRGPFASWTS